MLNILLISAVIFGLVCCFTINLIWGFIIWALISVYTLPSLIAYSDNHRSRHVICIINLFLGWTWLGWIICLIWVFTDQRYELNKF